MLALAAVVALACRGSEPVNVVLVVVDTLRTDALGSYGGPTPTPAFDALVRSGVLFENAVAPAPETAASHATLFTGLDVAHHGITRNGARLGDEITTLAEAFQAEGRATAGFASSFVLDPRFGFGRGFDRYDARFPRAGETVKNRRGFWSQHEFDGCDRRAAETNAVALPWLRDAPEPFFAFVHYFDPHAPSVVSREQLEGAPFAYARDEARERFAKAPQPRGVDEVTLRRLIRSYHAEVLYTDAALGELVAAIDARGIAKRTLVVVTADHGEGLGNHGLIDHAAHLYEEQLHVPLVFHWPGTLDAGIRLRVPVGLVDLAPTIAALAGVPFFADADGHSIASALRAGREPDARRLLGRRRRYPEPYQDQLGTKFFVRDGRWKYIRSTDAVDELYDLAADRTESVNRFEANPEVAARLAAELDAHLARHPLNDEPPVLSDDERRALEALGYGSH